MRPGRAGEGSARVVGPVDRPVHGLAHLDVVVEEAPAGVERDLAQARVHRLHPEPASVDAVLVGDALHFRRRDRPLVELVRLHHLERDLLVEVPAQVDSVQVSRRRAARPASPVRIAPQRGQAVDVVQRERIRAGRGQVGHAPHVDDLAVEGQLRRRRLEERHRQNRDQRIGCGASAGWSVGFLARGHR